MKSMTAGTDKQATIEELFDAVFSMLSTQKLYKKQ
jgi:hypothetical protein